MNAIGQRVVFQGGDEVALARRDVNHVGRGERGLVAFHIDLDAALSQQRDVVEIVDMPLIGIAGFDEVHLAQPQVADTGQVGYGCIHLFLRLQLGYGDHARVDERI